MMACSFNENEPELAVRVEDVAVLIPRVAPRDELRPCEATAARHVPAEAWVALGDDAEVAAIADLLQFEVGADGW